MMIKVFGLAIGLFAFQAAFVMASSSEELGGKYLLGPQDVLTIRVYDLRRNAGEAYPWTALNGDFIVGAEGYISLPIVGSIDAAGVTSREVASRIGIALKNAVGLAETPIPAVQVSRYRPFFIVGAVKQPGKYEFVPGLTVIQAISISQGLAAASDLPAARKEWATASGTLRTALSNRVILLARQARLEAEIAGLNNVSLPSELKTRAEERSVKIAFQAEVNIFSIRKASLSDQLSSLQRSIAVFKDEILALDIKYKAIDRLVNLSNKDLDAVNDLVSRGLAVAPRRLSAEQSQASYENQRLDVQLTRLKAQESIARAERDIIEVQAKYKNDAQSEEVDNRKSLAENKESIETAKKLLQEIGFASPKESNDLSLSFRYKITRIINSKAETWIANEDDPVQPGDVVRVDAIQQNSAEPG